MDIKYISESEVNERLKMDVCIKLMYDVFVGYSEGKIKNILRSMAPIGSGVLGVMPGVVSDKEAAGAKLITVIHDNAERGLPSHQGIVAIFDTVTGSLKGVCDGNSITAIRTGAVSGLATKYLSNEDASVLAILGSGVQAGMNLDAIKCVRNIKKVYVWSRNNGNAHKFIERAKTKYPDTEFYPCSTAKEAVESADIICTVTPGKDVVLKGEWIKAGAHINAVGACTKADREIDALGVAKSKLISDSETACRNEGGDFVLAIKDGAVSENHLLGTLGDVITGKITVRTNHDDITMFNSLGLAEEDIVCADWLLE